MRLLFLSLFGVALGAQPVTNAANHSPGSGPAKGHLIVIGGGAVGQAILDRFAALAGGLDAQIVVVPTAGEVVPPLEHHALKRHGFTHLVHLHTNDRKVADSAEFVAALKTAKGVWIDGGRQWRLVDSYLGTKTAKELDNVLERGGVIAGTSAGATIQGSYLVRGAREGNTIMMAKGYEEGFGFLRNVAIDQHLIARHRENDLVPVISLKPELLGIGLDEATAIVVTGDSFSVIGASKVAIYDTNYGVGADGKAYYWLQAGDCFDITARKKQSCAPPAGSRPPAR
jgi:cyanophycinase